MNAITRPTNAITLPTRLAVAFVCCFSAAAYAGPPPEQWAEDAYGCKVANPHPQPIESITWSGHCKDGFTDGAGTVRWFSEGRANGVSSGTFRQGKLTGQGYVTMPYADYKRSNVGKRDFNFRRVWAPGSRLDGEFLEGQLIGDGIMTKPNGQKVVVNEINGILMRKAIVAGAPRSP